MGFNANERQGGGNFVPVEALEPKNYPARLVQLILLGMQPQRPYQGQAKKPQETMYVTYELSHEFMNDADGNQDTSKPRWVSEEFPFFNLEADRAKSTLRYRALDPQGSASGDWVKVLTAPCQVTLTKEPRKGHEGQFVNYVSNVTGAMEAPGYEQPVLVNPTKIFDIEEPDIEVFTALPEWLQTKIKANLNYNGSVLQKTLGEIEPIAAPSQVPTTQPTQPTAPPAPPKPSEAG